MLSLFSLLLAAAAANAAATTRLSDGNEKAFRNFAPEKLLVLLCIPSFFIFAGGCDRGAAAATTRSSDGNENVFRNFTPENDL